MRIAVTDSIAADHLVNFPGKFTDQLLEGRLDRVSRSFLVDELDVRRGGTAANIAFGLGALGLTPLLVGAVGAAFDGYETWPKEHGVDTGHVRVSNTRQTARFMCTTDADQSQIASFYAGAMAEAAAVPVSKAMDPTGVGDAFRAGFLATRSWGPPLRVVVALGCALATTALEALGPQQYKVSPTDLLNRVEATYGATTSALLAPHLARATCP